MQWRFLAIFLSHNKLQYLQVHFSSNVFHIHYSQLFFRLILYSHAHKDLVILFKIF